MKFKSIALCSLLFSSLVAFAQEENADPVESLNQRVTQLEDAKTVSSKLKFSGYIQGQFESTQKDGSLKVGDSRSTITEAGKDMNRFGVRRGRLKATYDDNGCQYVLELDATEKSIKIKDVYLNILDPWVNVFSLRGGVFDRPFGYEVSYSSSRLESAERSRIIQTLFPDEKDLGGMLTIQAPKTSPWNVLKLDAGLFGGNSAAMDNDSKKDFIGHLAYTKAFGDMKIGLGVSGYYGFLTQTTKKVYTMSGAGFSVDSTATNKGQYAKRKYLGFDGQFSTKSAVGLTTIRAEYILGQQPVMGASDSKSPNGVASNPTAADTYIRNFRGGYIHLIQDIADTKHSISIKYDWYDPNTKVSGDQIGTAGTSGIKTNKADISYGTLGLAYLYRMNNNVRIMASYDINTNEKSAKLSGYGADLKDNVFTLRLQYKF